MIIQYNAGNIQSVRYALERLGVDATVTDNHEAIMSADQVIFPGVGEASSAMKYLREHGLDKIIMGLRQPVLGICLGMQLMCSSSEENDTSCLGIFDTQVRKFGTDGGRLKVPQIGWNHLLEPEGPLFNGLPAEPYCYFVHSYYASICPQTVAMTDYGIRFSSALQKENFFGVQFHPEKSAETGETILGNFLSLSRQEG